MLFLLTLRYISGDGQNMYYNPQLSLSSANSVIIGILKSVYHVYSENRGRSKQKY